MTGRWVYLLKAKLLFVPIRRCRACKRHHGSHFTVLRWAVQCDRCRAVTSLAAL
jgi:hypothetical protein